MAKQQLFYPMSDYLVTQQFGVNGEYYRAHGINIDGHNGHDVLSYHGKPVYASHDGIAFYQVDSSQGHGVVIIGDKPYDYKKILAYFKTIYWHLCDPKETKFASPVYLYSKANKGKGMPVKAGDLIGYSNNTGLSSGDHLHFGLKPVLQGKPPTSGDAPDIDVGNWVNVEQNNGYLGAIDPTPYFNGQFANNAQAFNARQGLLVKALETMVKILTSLLKK